jgi:hypothetical protein
MLCGLIIVIFGLFFCKVVAFPVECEIEMTQMYSSNEITT